MVKLISKNSNLCDHNPPTLQTDRQTTCDGNTALCTISASRGKKKKKSSLPISVTHISIIVTLAVIKVVFILHVLGLALVLYLVMQHVCCESVIKNSVQFSPVQSIDLYLYQAS